MMHGRVAIFVQKFYDIVSHPNYFADTVVGWNEEGDAVIVHDPHELERLVLPQFFKHDKYSSFVRQLNQYNFHKSRQSKVIEFSNPNFLRGRPELLVLIERKQPITQRYPITDPMSMQGYAWGSPPPVPHMAQHQLGFGPQYLQWGSMPPPMGAPMGPAGAMLRQQLAPRLGGMPGGMPGGGPGQGREGYGQGQPNPSQVLSGGGPSLTQQQKQTMGLEIDGAGSVIGAIGGSVPPSLLGSMIVQQQAQQPQQVSAETHSGPSSFHHHLQQQDQHGRIIQGEKDIPQHLRLMRDQQQQQYDQQQQQQQQQQMMMAGAMGLNEGNGGWALLQQHLSQLQLQHQLQQQQLQQLQQQQQQRSPPPEQGTSFPADADNGDDCHHQEHHQEQQEQQQQQEEEEEEEQSGADEMLSQPPLKRPHLLGGGSGGCASSGATSAAAASYSSSFSASPENAEAAAEADFSEGAAAKGGVVEFVLSELAAATHRATELEHTCLRLKAQNGTLAKALSAELRVSSYLSFSAALPAPPPPSSLASAAGAGGQVSSELSSAPACTEDGDDGGDGDDEGVSVLQRAAAGAFARGDTALSQAILKSLEDHATFIVPTSLSRPVSVV